MQSAANSGTSLLKPINVNDTRGNKMVVQETGQNSADFLSILKNEGSGGEAALRTFKNYATVLYYNSPKTYTVIKETFNLPNQSDLDKTPVYFEMGLSKKVLDITVENHINVLTPTTKSCVLVLQKVLLEPNVYYNIDNGKVLGFCDYKDEKYIFADMVVIMMLKGLLDDWSQVIGHQLTSTAQSAGDFADRFIENIKKVLDVGFLVHALVVDTSMAELIVPLVNSPDKPSINVSYSGQKKQEISIIFDRGDVLKNIALYFEKNDIQFSPDNTACWKDILQFYEADSFYKKTPNAGRLVMLAPHLTDNHFDGDMNVSKAADILSHAVGVGITTYNKEGLPESVSSTGKLVMTIGSAFEILNSSTPFINQMKYVYILTSCVNFLDSIKNDCDYFKYFKMTILSVMQLCTTVNLLLNGEKTLDLRQLCMKPVNDFVQELRDEVDVVHAYNLDIKHFLDGFGRVLLKSLLKKSSTGEEEELLAFMNYNDKLKRITSMNVIIHKQMEPLISEDKIIFEQLVEDSLMYISNSVYKEYLNARKCGHANIARKKFNAPSSDGKPPPAFITYIINLDSKFIRYLHECMTQEEGIVISLLHKLSPVTPLQAECCHFFPQKMIVTKFIQLRVSHVIHVVNLNYSHDSCLQASIKGLQF